MRKSLVTFILLLVLAGYALNHANCLVNGGKDAVVIDEIVLFGEKSAASGVEVNFTTHCDYHLFWDTRYVIGEDPVTDTSFTFSQRPRLPQQAEFFHIYLSNPFGDYGWEMSEGNRDLRSEKLYPPVQDVASRTNPGEEHTEILYIKDYYDYYPLTVNFFVPPTGFGVDVETHRIFDDFFKIPVYPGDSVAITVEKDKAGNIRSVGYRPVKGGAGYEKYSSDATYMLSSPETIVGFETGSVMIDTRCFFTLSPQTPSGELLDTSLIPGGYGIYSFPLSIDLGGNLVLKEADLQTVFSVDAERAKIAGLELNVDKTQILLVTIQDGMYVLTVIDVSTMKELQQIQIMPAAVAGSFWRMHVYDDFLVMQFGESSLALLEITETGEYFRKFIGDYGHTQELHHTFGGPLGMAYDGQRLAVGGVKDGLGYNCDFYVAVFDDSGLVFVGHYEHSQDDDGSGWGRCRMGDIDDTPLKLAWGG